MVNVTVWSPSVFGLLYSISAVTVSPGSRTCGQETTRAHRHDCLLPMIRTDLLPEFCSEARNLKVESFRTSPKSNLLVGSQRQEDSMQNHRLVRQRATFQVQQWRGRTQELERQQTQFLLAVGCWLLAVHSSLDTSKVKIARRLEVKLRLAVPENNQNLASFAKISTPGN